MAGTFFSYPEQFNNPQATRFITGVAGDMAGVAYEPESYARTPDEYQDDAVSEKDQKLVQAICRILKMEEAVKRPVQDRADMSWELYHSSYEYYDKDDWQSKKKFPLVFSTVERLAAAVVRILERSTDWFEIEAIVPNLQVYVNLAKNWLKFWLDHDTVKFIKVFRDAVKSGLLTAMMHVLVTFEDGGVPVSEGESLTTPEGGEVPFDLGLFQPLRQPPGATPAGEVSFANLNDLPRLRLEVINSSQIWLNHSGSNLYKMWITKLSLGEYLAQAKKRGFDMAAVQRSIRGTNMRALDRATEALEKNLNPAHDQAFNEVTLLNCEGTFYHPDTGEPLAEKSYFVIANETELVLKPRDIPFWDQDFAVVSAAFIDFPHSVYGKSLIGENIDAFHTKLELVNLILDFFNISLLGMREVDKSLLADDDDFLEYGCYPGKTFMTDSRGTPTPNVQAVKAVPQADLPSGFWQFLQYFETKTSENTAMTQELGGQPRTRGRVTGMEFNARYTEAGALVGFIFSGIEDNLISPLLRVAFLRVLQFTPDKLWKAWVLANIPALIPENTPPEIGDHWREALTKAADWDAKTRYRNLGAFFKFKTKVFSSLVDRQMEIEKGAFLLNILARIPNAFQMIRLDEIVRYIVRAFGWDPEKILQPGAMPPPAGENGLQAMTGEAPTSEVPDITGGIQGLLRGLVEQGDVGPAFPGGPSSPGPGGLPSPPGGGVV